MSTQQPSRPVITPAMREQAVKQPNTWLYVVDPIFTDPNVEVPPWGFIGGYRVDEQGELTDDFSPNPNYRPSPVALRLPAPANDLERALQLTTTGYAQGQTLLSALLDAELILFAQPQGNGLFTVEHESGRRQLQVFTSDSYLPTKWSTWQRMTGRQLAGQQLAGIDVQINPSSPVKARIPGEDLLKAAAMAPPRTPAALESSNLATATTSSPHGTPDTQAGTPTPSSDGTLADTQIPEAPAQETRVQEVPAQEVPEQGVEARRNGTPVAPDATQPVPSTSTPAEPTPDPAETDFGQRFLGSLLAGAIGDALGSAVEFYPVDQIRSRFGERGVADYDRNSDRPGEFTDDTQMTLFGLEGLIRGHIAVRHGNSESPLPAIQLGYQRWLHTQGYAWTRAAGPFGPQHPEPTGWLIKQRDLFSVRSPNSSCITALREFSSVGAPGTFDRDINDSQDCGGTVRAAPIALWSETPKEVFELAAASAALTYSHPNGYLPAGVLAVIVHQSLRGASLEDALGTARELLTSYAGHADTENALRAATELARGDSPTPELIKDSLGGGWNGHEALAIAVCAALSTDGIAPAVMRAVNHSGGSDSTGAICGNIVGAQYGSGALPGVWLRDLKQRELLETLGKDALREFGQQPPTDPEWLARYPAENDRSELVFTSDLPLAEAAPDTSADAEPTAATSEAIERQEQEPTSGRRNRFLGCLLGGAVGDALGYPVESYSLTDIRREFGQRGVTGFAGEAGGSISDATQMTLFTLDGLVRAGIRRRTHGANDPALDVRHAYQRWLHTQGFDWKDAAAPDSAEQPDGWLIQHKELFARRGPGATSIQALHGYATGARAGSLGHRVNESKGCGGVMRAAPSGLWDEDPAEVFRIGALTAALTHGHSDGYLPAGVLAVIVQQLVAGNPLTTAIERAFIELTAWDGNEATSTALRRAIDLAAEGVPNAEQIEQRLGSGLVGDQALSIAICAALSHPESFEKAVLLAANHSGSSDSTAAICGNIMGAALSVDAVPQRWREHVELGAVFAELADDALREFGAEPATDQAWLDRYPIDTTAVSAEERGEPVEREPSHPPVETEVTKSTEATSGGTVRQPVVAPADSGTANEDTLATDSAHSPVSANGSAPITSASTVSTPAGLKEAATEGESGESAAFAHPATATAAEPTPAPAAEAAPAPTPDAEATPDTKHAEADDQSSTDDGLSDEELRLLAAWRKFRDGADDTPSDLSQGLHKLLAEAFGAERAAQLVDETGAESDPRLEEPAAEQPVQLDRGQRLLGCVLAGAVGDALGGPWMFTDVDTIRQHNPDGPRQFTEFLGRRGTATALSQQAAFVLDGLIRAALCARLRGVDANTYPPGMVRLTLQHWAWGQGARFDPSLPVGVLAKSPELTVQRFPDEVSLIALTQHLAAQAPTASQPPNAARTATATARAAVVGFHAATPESAVSLGSEVAVVTHGHPDGYLPSGALAGLVTATVNGKTLADSVRLVLGELDLLEGSEPTTQGLRAALDLASRDSVTPETLAELGTGWNGPEALAIAVCAALAHPDDLPAAIALAATHSGNSAATAMMCGSLLGAARGTDAIAPEWLAELELRETLEQLCSDEIRMEAEVRNGDSAPEWAARYLG